ncbi:MAG: hydantoinase/oxoprolinase family protein [Beijerinckiaceae bacterium]|nr:hydantoinase/oxoprolinase family protein [Beijerinckiaceae bacterium]
MSLVVALDIGGTFTDLVAFDLSTGTVIQAKDSTTPYDLSVGIRKTLAKSGLPISRVDTFVHGSTVAINTAIERTGAKTALIVTQGTRDVYQIGRGNRPESYNFLFKRPQPLVPRRRTFEIVERLDAEGEVVVELDVGGVAPIAERLKAEQVEATAVCLIHSWANPAHEVAVGDQLKKLVPDLFHSLSHGILREYREYERISTTVLNSYVGPRVSRYLQDFENLLGDAEFRGQFLIMQSNGGAMSPETARLLPVATMESGPVGGIIAASETGRELGVCNLIAFDMGGTTAKVSLVQENEPVIAQGYFVGGEASGLPVMYPVIDIVEVGAGGGSIAWIDEVGALKVGPRSAGGHPGPVCYGLGGEAPTVTDANLILGRLGSDRFLGGEMQLDTQAARTAIQKNIAGPLGVSVEDAALGIIKIAVAEMSLAVQSVSIGRGHDPRDFAMVAFGGAGPLHAAEIARELNIPKVIIPRVPGHFSALGMLLADLRHDFVRTYYKPLAECDFAALQKIFAEMEASARDLLIAEGMRADQTSIHIYLDMRYAGQEFPIQTPVSAHAIAEGDMQALRAAFDRSHERRFGHQAVHEDVEVVNCRLTGRGRRDRVQLPSTSVGSTGSGLIGARDMIFDGWGGAARQCPVYQRDELPAGERISGPAAVSEYASTTILHEGDVLTVAASGELVIEINRGH